MKKTLTIVGVSVAAVVLLIVLTILFCCMKGCCDTCKGK